LRIEIATDLEQLPLAGYQAEEVDERRGLQQGDELVHEGGQHAANALRDHHQPHRRWIAETQCARGLQLSGLHALDARTQDFADVGRRHQTQCGDAQRVGVVAGEAADDWPDAESDQQDDDHLRQAPEDVGIDPGRPAQPPGSGDAGDRQN
jgi:hypothetical protein